MNKYLPLANDQKINQHNLSDLDQFDKFVSLAHFPVSKKRTMTRMRTPFHFFQLTSRALTVPLPLPSCLRGDRSPYYFFVTSCNGRRHFAPREHTCPHREVL